MRGDTVREANASGVKHIRQENAHLKQLVADLSLKNDVLKKSLNRLESDGADRGFGSLFACKQLTRLIHKLRLKNEFDLRIKGNWIFERCKATASGKASLEY